MPVQINIIDDGNGIEYLATGVVTGKEIIEANQKTHTPDILHPAKYKIVDRTGCTDYRVTEENIRTLSQQDLRASQINNDIVIVLVSQTPLQFGMTRMWQAHIEKTGLRTEIFN